MKKVIKLNENDLHNIIKESVKKILKEKYISPDYDYDLGEPYNPEEYVVKTKWNIDKADFLADEKATNTIPFQLGSITVSLTNDVNDAKKSFSHKGLNSFLRKSGLSAYFEIIPMSQV